MPEPQTAISRGSALAAAGCVFAISLVLYVLTLAPTVTLVDSGELILASAKLGVPHPPGFPLYVMLAHLASLVPVGNVAVRVNLVSAFSAAAASAMMTLLVAELMISAVTKNASTEDGGRKQIVVLVPAVAAGLIFAFSRTLWAYATIAEVYATNSLLIVAILWLTFSWRRGFDRAAPDYRRLYMAALVFGLAMGVHHVTVAFFLPSLALLVYLTAGRGFFASKAFLISAAAAFAAGVCVYLYLPLAASQSPIMNWGEPRDLGAVWQHVTGRQYQVNFQFESKNLVDLGRFLLREWSVAWLPAVLSLAAVGLAERARRDKALAAFLGLVVLVNIAYCSVYSIAEDKDAYFLPTFIAVTMLCAFGIRAVFRWAVTRPLGWQIAAIGVAAAVPIAALISNLPFNDRHDYYIAEDYVDNINASVEQGGMVLTADWQAYAPSFYTREIAGRRRDVIFIDVNLLRRSWYFAYLEQAYPEMMERSKGAIEAYRTELRSWDRDPAAYERPGPNQRINQRFQQMVVSIIEEQLKTKPLYYTYEMAGQGFFEEVPLPAAIREKYEVVPQGLVFRVVEKGSSELYAAPSIKTRGLNDGTLRFDEDDVVRRVVIPAYTVMLTNTGVYYGTKGRTAAAADKFRQALALDPAYEPAKKGLAAATRQ